MHIQLLTVRCEANPNAINQGGEGLAQQPNGGVAVEGEGDGRKGDRNHTNGRCKSTGCLRQLHVVLLSVSFPPTRDDSHSGLRLLVAVRTDQRKPAILSARLTCGPRPSAG